MNQMKKMLGAIFSIFLVSSGAIAQGNPQVFNLKSSIEYSLKNNPTSTIYRNDVEITRFSNRNALATYLPQVNGNYSHDFNAKLPTNIIPAGVFGPEETRIQMGQKHVNGASVQLDQKIYDQSAIVALKAMKQNDSLSILKMLKNNEDLIYQTANAYYQVLIISEQEKLLRENEKQYADLLKILKLQFEKGVIKKMDYDRTRVAYNNITSQMTLLETNKKVALNKLKVAIGMPIEELLAIDETIDLNEEIAMPVETNIDVTKRIDYLIQEKTLLLQGYQVKSMKYSGLPTISAYARYGANAYGTELGESFKTWLDYSAIGLKVSVPIFNGMRAYNNYKSSQLDLMNLQESAKLNIQNYKLETQNANTQLLSSYTSLGTNRENMNLAKEVYDASNVEYKAGQSSLTDLLNSDYSFKESQSNYINSLLNFLSSRLDYEKSKGTLTNYISQLK